MTVYRKAVDPDTVWCKDIGFPQNRVSGHSPSTRTGTRCYVTHTVQKKGYKHCLGNDSYLSMSIYIYIYILSVKRLAGSLATGRKFLEQGLENVFV